MRGNYKVYNANKGEWVNLPLNYMGEGLQLKIENNRLRASYDGGQTWNDVGEVGANIEPTYTHCTYKDLVGLRNSSKLIPGAFYRITDYECTTTQADSRSLNHPFDIIVQALDESTLSENAQAIQHEGDEYFANAKFEAWKLKYTVDNDASRFAWAKEEIKEVLGSWDSDAGYIKTVTSKEDDILPEKTIMINGVETPVFCPANINNYDFSTFDIGRPGRTYSYDEFKRFKYLGNEKPYSNTITIEGDYGYGDSSKTYYDWSNVEKIWVYLDDELVTTMDSRGDGYFADLKGGNWARFIPEPEYIDEQHYCYEPTYSSEWHEHWLSNSGRWNYNWISDFNPQDYIYCIYTHDFNVYRLYSETKKKVYLDRNEKSLINIYHTPYIEYRPSGKGVIYRMIDEHNNDCPFDFKNMQFSHNGKWYYTFSYFGEDASLGDYCANNHLTIVQNQDNHNTVVTTTMPMLVFNLIHNTADKIVTGILNNDVQSPIAKGFIQGFRISGNNWLPTAGGRNGYFTRFDIYSSGGVYSNIFRGFANNFVVGSADKLIEHFYGNTMTLSAIRNFDITIDCTYFVGNTYNVLVSGSGAKSIVGGYIQNCYFDDYGYPDEKDANGASKEVKLKFESTQTDPNGLTTYAIANCYIRLFGALTIKYGNTTSNNAPLRFLNVNARGWGSGTIITIPSEFPANAHYELKVAKDSTVTNDENGYVIRGKIKMWCDADLIKEIP